MLPVRTQGDNEEMPSMFADVVSRVCEDFNFVMEVEQHFAGEVALGDRLGLWDLLDGMGYAGSASKTVQRTNIADIEQRTITAASSKDDFLNFLMEVRPVTDLIRNNPAYKFTESVEASLAKLLSDFEEVQERLYYSVSNPTYEDELAFEAAGAMFQCARLDNEKRVIRQIIATLLERFPGVTAIKPGRQSFLARADMVAKSNTNEASDPAASIRSELGLINRSETFLAHTDAPAWPDIDHAFQDAALMPIDRGMFNKFVKSLNSLSSRTEANTVGRASVQASASSLGVSPTDAVPVSDMYIAPEPSSASWSIHTEDLGGVTLVDNAGGGDCLFYALGIERSDMSAFRNRIAEVISEREDTPRQRAYNAQMVAAAVLQTGLSEDVPNFRQLEIPNEVYAEMVRIPGIYAGEDELLAFTQLPENKGRTVVMIDSDGVIARFRDGTREAVSYTSENFNEVIGSVLADAEIALYKTPNHWQQIEPI